MKLAKGGGAGDGVVYWVTLAMDASDERRWLVSLKTPLSPNLAPANEAQAKGRLTLLFE